MGYGAVQENVLRWLDRTQDWTSVSDLARSRHGGPYALKYEIESTRRAVRSLEAEGVVETKLMKGPPNEWRGSQTQLYVRLARLGRR
jgi:hypothetical protein